jgi:hypothetical protein
MTLMTRHLRSFALLAALLLLRSGASAQPRLEVTGGSTFDLGRILRGDSSAHTLTLRNAGNADLEITSVQASCGCTGTLLSARVLAPGASGSVRISFNSSNFSGPIHKSVTIVSNDAAAPRTVVEFTATVIDEMVLEPPQFWFGNATVGQRVRTVVRIRNGGDAPLALRSPQSTLAGLVVRLPSTAIAPGATDSLVAEFLPTEATGFLSSQVALTTSNPRHATVRIPVYGSVKEFVFEGVEHDPGKK